MNKKAVLAILVIILITCLLTPIICLGSVFLRVGLYNNEYRHAQWNKTDNLGIDGYTIGITRDKVNNKSKNSLYIEGHGKKFVLFSSDWFLIDEKFEYQLFDVNGTKYLIYSTSTGGNSGNLGFAIYKLDLPNKIELMRIPEMSAGKNEFILKCTHPLFKRGYLSYLGSQGYCDVILFDPKAILMEFDINQALVSTTIYPE